MKIRILSIFFCSYAGKTDVKKVGNNFTPLSQNYVKTNGISPMSLSNGSFPQLPATINKLSLGSWTMDDNPYGWYETNENVLFFSNVPFESLKKA